MDIPRLLTDFRLSLGVNQRELAVRLGVTKQTVSAYEQGVRVPHPTIALRYMGIAKKHGKQLELEWWIEKP